MAAKAKRRQRCWPGYEPVPGKPEHTQGSCRKKAASKLTPSERRFRKKRERQLESWERAHPKSPRKAAQHLHAPTARKRKKRRAARKTGKSKGAAG